MPGLKKKLNEEPPFFVKNDWSIKVSVDEITQNYITGTEDKN